MKKFLLPVIAIMAAVPLYADNSKLPMNDFLQLSRRRNQTATYARLQGTLQHRRRGAAVLKSSLQQIGRAHV